MELHAIEMSRGAARQAFLEYRASTRALLDKEVDALDERRREKLREQREHDEAVMRGYRVIASGETVIDLAATIRAGGEDELHRPRLAVARADNRRIRMERQNRGTVRFFGGYQRSDHRDPRTLDDIRFEALLPVIPSAHPWVNAADAWAIVPSIPPRFRPADLTRYHLLWEADWQAAPVDPALLRALGDGLYAVVATWDLTPVERAVLGIRRQ